MKVLREPGAALRILLILGFLILLGFAPRPHAADRALQQARSARQAGQTEAYARSLRRAAEHLPGRAGLWETAGQAALQAGEPQEAISDLQQALALGELSPAGRLSLGDAYQQLGELEQAIEVWQQGTPSPAAYTRLLQAHLSARSYLAAIDILEEQLRLQPGDPRGLYQLGLLLAATQPESASPYLRQAAEQNPALAAQAAAIDYRLRLAIAVGEPAYTFLEAGRALAALGEWELALEAFQQAARRRPDWADALAFLGEARQHLPLRGQETGQALSDLEKALALDPTSIAANVFMAMYWQRRQQTGLALEYLSQATSADPDNPALLAEVGNFLSETGDLSSAQAFYERAIALAPNSPVYWRLLAEFSIHNGLQVRQLALPAARQAVILAPRDPASLDVMGRALFALEDYRNAGRFYLRALRVDPEFAPARLHLGMNYLMQDQPARALEQFRQASALAPGTPVAEQAQRLLDRYFP